MECPDQLQTQLECLNLIRWTRQTIGIRNAGLGTGPGLGYPPLGLKEGIYCKLSHCSLPRAVGDVAAEEAGAGAGARGRLLPRLALRQLQVAVRTAGARVPQQPAQLELVQAHLNKMIINL